MDSDGFRLQSRSLRKMNQIMRKQSPAPADIINTMIVVDDGHSNQCVMMAIPANILLKIVMNLATNFAVVSALRLRSTCKTMSGRLAIYKVVRLDISSAENSVEYKRIPHSQIQVDSLYPLITRYGVSIRISIVSDTKAIIKKESPSGGWKHSVLIEGGKIIHLHCEFGKYRVTVYKIGVDLADLVSRLATKLGIKCEPSCNMTGVYTAEEMIFSGSNVPEDRIISELIGRVDRASCYDFDLYNGVEKFAFAYQKATHMVKVIDKWISALDDIRMHPDQYVLRATTGEPINRWSAEMMESSVSKSLRKTIEWSNAQTVN